MSHCPSWQFLGHICVEISPLSTDTLQPNAQKQNINKIMLFSSCHVSGNESVKPEKWRIDVINKTGIACIKLTINLYFTQFAVGIHWIEIMVLNIPSTFIVVDDVSSGNRTVDAYVLQYHFVFCLIFMETEMAVFLWSCVGNV